MTSEIDILRIVLKEHDKVSRLKTINEELYHHLTGSIYYLTQYSEKYNIALPKKEELLRMIEKADFLIEQFAHPTTFDMHKNPTESGQNPVMDSVKSQVDLLSVKIRLIEDGQL